MVPPLIVHVFPGFATGRAQSRFVALANRFGPAYRHAVVSLDGSLGSRARLSPGLDVSFPMVALPRGRVTENLPHVRTILRCLGPDVLVTSDWASIGWAMANIPAVARHIHTEDGSAPEGHDRQSWRRGLARRLVLARSTVVVPSHALLRIAVEQWRLPRGRLRLIPDGVDLARFAPGAAAATGWPGTGPVIGTVAALRLDQRLDRLVDAMALLRDTPARLVIVGEGPERAALAAQAAALGLGGRVLLPGASADTPGCYAGLAVFCLGADAGQMPPSVLEAMAAGLPVVATAREDVARVLPAAQHPFLCGRDPGALAAGLRTLLGDEALRARLGAANLDAARAGHGEEAMLRAHDALWGGAVWGDTAGSTARRVRRAGLWEVQPA